MFFSFNQEIALQLLVTFGVLQGDTKGHFSAVEYSQMINNYLCTVEMCIAAIAHQIFFSWRDYTPLTGAAARTPFINAAVHTMLPSDLVFESRHHLLQSYRSRASAFSSHQSAAESPPPQTTAIAAAAAAAAAVTAGGHEGHECGGGGGVGGGIGGGGNGGGGVRSDARGAEPRAGRGEGGGRDRDRGRGHCACARRAVRSCVSGVCCCCCWLVLILLMGWVVVNVLMDSWVLFELDLSCINATANSSLAVWDDCPCWAFFGCDD